MGHNIKMVIDSPSCQTSFLPQFPISVDHEWMIDLYSTADRKMNTGGRASQLNQLRGFKLDALDP